MSDELRAAAERLRRYYSGPPQSTKEYALGQEVCDLRTLADAYLAEHPADDDTPIDAEWLDECLKNWCAPYGAEGWEVMANCIIRHSERGFFPVFSYTGQGATGAELKTRGDVRRLCAALGIALKESKR